MTLVPLDIPAGVYRNGTDFDAFGRWRDANLVRWRDGSLRPIGGWRTRVSSAITYAPRGAHAWIANNSSSWLALGSYNQLRVVNQSGTAYTITPSGFTTGLLDAAVLTGYGNSTYGTSYYGTERPDTGNYSEASTFSLDNWGEYLVACSHSDGKLYEWQLDTSTIAAQISNAPVGNLGLIVTEERFLVALGAGSSPRKLQWCDRENNTVWTASATNEAGDIELQTTGRIMTALRTRGQTLVLTDVDAHTMRYQGPPYVYGVERVGTSCGIISRKAAADVDIGVFYMGTGGFFHFDGNSVKEIPCEGHDFIFGDLNKAQVSKVWAVTNAEFGEIWWFYPSANATECDKYVAFDFKEGHWMTGQLSRTAGVDRGVFKYPFFMTSGGNVVEHEVGFNYDSNAVYAETGPISIGTGENVMSVSNLIPDEATQGDVTATFKARMHPNDTERSYGPFTMANPTSVRFTGRQARMRVTGARNAAWRVGTMRIDAKPMGKR